MVDMDPFDFDLPEDRIALRPARPRDSARLLVCAPDGQMQDGVVGQLADQLSPGDVLVVNDTKVIPAALTGIRPARGVTDHGVGQLASDVGSGNTVHITVNLLERVGPERLPDRGPDRGPEREPVCWVAFAKPGKRLRVGDNIVFGDAMSARVQDKYDDGRVRLAFSCAGAALTDAGFDQALSALGAPPIPPYIARRRGVDGEDTEDYQTLFAEHAGSVAAPTAGLHFTPAMTTALARRGVAMARVTLHVGAGTFAPLSEADMASKTLHAEHYDIPDETVAAIHRAKAAGRAVVAVGTTSLRALESAWDHHKAALRAGPGRTQLFLQPGDSFGVVDRLMTNFHLPRSSLFMLVCAFAGTDVARAAYAHAIASQYRFYSYGDACLFTRGAG